ncbi:hypothetical protein CDAR_88441 [Caerostris darwini]|uniref:Uncharacterized protein n=1 Tax=Caerostris darwini TaxID=1538125 RepID=A0AAV4Q1A8_9ARAC|nr:hypothetical protein CDAR_88441 [Caerostris darwini]
MPSSPKRIRDSFALITHRSTPASTPFLRLPQIFVLCLHYPTFQLIGGIPLSLRNPTVPSTPTPFLPSMQTEHPSLPLTPLLPSPFDRSLVCCLLWGDGMEKIRFPVIVLQL